MSPSRPPGGGYTDTVREPSVLRFVEAADSALDGARTAISPGYSSAMPTLSSSATRMALSPSRPPGYSDIPEPWDSGGGE